MKRFIGEVLATLGEERLAAIRRRTAGTGARALLDCFDRFNRELAATAGCVPCSRRSRSARCES